MASHKPAFSPFTLQQPHVSAEIIYKHKIEVRQFLSILKYFLAYNAADCSAMTCGTTCGRVGYLTEEW